MEVEMLDIDKIDETSEFYNTAQEARNQMDKSGGSATPLRPVIAVVVSNCYTVPIE